MKATIHTYNNGVKFKARNKRTYIFTNKEGNISVEIVRALSKNEDRTTPSCRSIIIKNRVLSTELTLSLEGALMLHEALCAYLQSIVINNQSQPSTTTPSDDVAAGHGAC